MRAVVIIGGLAFARADCGWTSTCGPRGCADCKDDGTAGYRECCRPGPGPTTGPTPAPGPTVEYCPDPATDFQEERESGASGTVTWTDSGWSIKGWLRVSSKASFDFSGGGASWDMDLSEAHNGVNNNFYLTYPWSDNCGISCYCDSGGNHDSQGRGCAELDWTENNGHCYSATTWHNPSDGSDGGGHGDHTNLNGGTNSYKTAYSADGSNVDITVNGHTMGGSGQAGDMKSKGAVIYSSQWTGWVPGDCGSGDRDTSVYTVKSLKITGRVVHGPEPRKCHPDTPSPSPPPTGPAACTDENQNCSDWSKTGECKNNPGWMLTHCKKSCGVCKQSDRRFGNSSFVLV
jgi:hypothetical protein